MTQRLERLTLKFRRLRFELVFFNITSKQTFLFWVVIARMLVVVGCSSVSHITLYLVLKPCNDRIVLCLREQETSLGDKRIENHGDRDFEKTLEQLDSSRKKVLSVTVVSPPLSSCVIIVVYSVVVYPFH